MTSSGFIFALIVAAVFVVAIVVVNHEVIFSKSNKDVNHHL